MGKRASKVVQTKAAKEKYTLANADLIQFLLVARDKEELADILHCSEREARDIVSEMACHYVVLSDSKHRGYRLADNPATMDIDKLQAEFENVELVEQELLSRIKVLKKRLKPIMAWLDVAQKRLSGNEKN